MLNSSEEEDERRRPKHGRLCERERRHSRRREGGRRTSDSDSQTEQTSEEEATLKEDSVGVVKRVPLSETARRRQNRNRLTQLKKEARKRESEGKIPFFVVVDDAGHVYGNGLKNWKKKVKKLSYTLDPTVFDVRRFTKDALREARDKLGEKFEYSAKLCKGFFKGVLGKALSQRRSALLALIESGIPCPLSFDERVWNTPDKFKDDPTTKKKRSDSKQARASRGSGGRTGPLGKSCMRQKLSELLGRSPDPEEMEWEMKRDKGWSGRKRKTPALAKFLTCNASDTAATAPKLAIQSCPDRFA